MSHNNKNDVLFSVSGLQWWEVPKWTICLGFMAPCSLRNKQSSKINWNLNSQVPHYLIHFYKMVLLIYHANKQKKVLKLSTVIISVYNYWQRKLVISYGRFRENPFTVQIYIHDDLLVFSPQLITACGAFISERSSLQLHCDVHLANCLNLLALKQQ